MLKFIRLAIIVFPFFLTACGSYQPYDYQDRDDGMSGPGLLSGDKGEFVIFRRSEEPQDRNSGRGESAK